MNATPVLARVAALAPLLLAGCGIFGDSRPGIAKVEDLVDRIERVHVDSELAKQGASDAVQQLRALAAPSFRGDAVKAYEGVEAAVATSERRADALQASLDAMQAAAEPVFAQWRADLDLIVSARVRVRSEERLRATRERYDAIVSATRPALESHRALNRDLRDLSLFLAHDFNAGAVSTIGEDVATLDTQVRNVGSQLDRCLTAARTYLDAAAAPNDDAAVARPQR